MKRFQRFIAFLLAVAMVCQSVPNIAVASEPIKRSEDFIYSVREDGTVQIDGYMGEEKTSPTHIVIPEEIEGKVVSALAQEAFSYCTFVDTIVVPKGVKTIGNSAFYHCEDLKAIVFLGDTPTLGFTVVEGSKSLERLYALNTCDLSFFCNRMINDIGEEQTAEVTVLEFETKEELMADFEAYCDRINIAASFGMQNGIAPIAEADPEDFNLEWEILDGGILEISGEGDMLNLYVTDYPWYDRYEEIKQVHIRGDVTGVSNYAFMGYTNLETVDFWCPIKTIGELAFSECTSLKQIGFRFETKAPTIASTAFNQVAAEIQYPEGYDGWDALQKTAWGKACTWIPYATICATGNVDENIGWKLYTNGDLYIYGSGAMPDLAGVWEYGWYDYKDQILQIYVQESVSSLGRYAFQEYAQITYVEIGASVNAIGAEAFSGCLSLSCVHFSGSAPSIGEYAFAGASAQILYPQGEESWDDVVGRDYGGTLEWVSYPTTPNGSYGGNMRWEITDAGQLNLYGNGEMTSQTRPEDYPWYAYRDQIVSISLFGEGITSIGDYAFCGYSTLDYITWYDTPVTKIGAYAFSNCENLSGISMDGPLSFIGEGAFSGCSNLETLRFYGEAPVIGENAFSGVNATIWYPLGLDGWDTVVKQQYGGTLYWEGEAVTLASGDYGSNGFRWYLDSRGVLSIMGEGAMESQSSAETYPWYPYRDQIKVVDMDYTMITSIGDYAFAGYTRLTEVAMEVYSETEDTITIGAYAFAGANKLDTISNNMPIASIGTGAFSGCLSLTSLRLYGCVPVIGENAFLGMTAVIEYDSTEGDWTNVANVSYGGSITWKDINLGVEGTFGNLTWVLDANGVLTISGTGAMPEEEMEPSWLTYSNKIKSVVIENGITTIASFAFLNCWNMTEVSIPDTVTKIGYQAFSWSGLKSVIIPASVVDTKVNTSEGEEWQSGIGVGAFSYCENLETVTILAPLKTIPYEAFAYCWNLKEVVFPNTLEVIGAFAFAETSIAELILPNSVTEIGMMAFSLCSKLTKVTLPAHLTWISKGAFGGCSALTSIHVAEENTVYANDEQGALYNKNYTELILVPGGFSGDFVVPNTVTKISDQAFDHNSKINCVTFTGQAPVFGEEIFFGMTLTAYYPMNVDSWSEEVFATEFGGTVTWIEKDIEVVIAEGTCGENATWTLTNLGVLTISGSGYVAGNDYDYSLWSTYGPFATSIVVEDGITAFSKYCFNNLTNATSLRLPKTLTSIGEEAFQDLLNMKIVIFTGRTAPTWVDKKPFDNMLGLEMVKVPADDYESYLDLMATLPNTVAVETEEKEVRVWGLEASQIHSKTVVLEWEPHISSDVVSYSIYRNNVLVGTSTICAFADRTLEPEKAYLYTVRANFSDGTTSPESKQAEAITVLPSVLDILVDNDVNKVADGYNTMYVFVPRLSNLQIWDEQTAKVTALAVVNGEMIPIGEGVYNSSKSTKDVAAYAVTWDLTDLPDGDYEVTAVLTDIDGSEGSLTEMLTVDQTLPAKLSNVVAYSDALEIGLNWTMALEIDTLGYHVYRKAENEETFTLLAKVSGRSTQSYTDRTAAEDIIYQYYVVGVDDMGREGEPSEVVGATRMLDADAPKITLLEPADHKYVHDNLFIRAKAEDNVSVTKMELSYSTDGGLTWTVLTEGVEPFLGYIADTTKWPDGALKLRVLAWDAAGNVSDAFVHTYIVDNGGPTQVTNLSYVSTETGLTLRWDDVADSDRGWFEIQRKKEDGSYETIQEKVTALGYVITGLTPNTSYTYRVLVYDVLGNPGEPSDDLVATTLADKTGAQITLLTPQSGCYADEIVLHATAEDVSGIGSITLQISTNGYVWTDLYSQTYEEAKEKQILTTTLSLESYEEGSLYVRAFASDIFGNVGEASGYVEHKIDKTAPAPVVVSAIGYEGYVELRWDRQEEDVAFFTILRADAENGEYQELQKVSKLNAFDREVEPGVTYYYQVIATDLAGNESEPSAVIEGTALPDEKAPEILSVYPAIESIIGPSMATVRVLARDNRALDSIVIEYSLDGETYQTLLEKTQIGEYNDLASAALPLENVEHGATVWVKIYVSDITGNVCKSEVFTYTVDREAPTVESTSLSYEDGAITLLWIGGMEPDLAGYRVYRKTVDGEYALVQQIEAVAEQSEYSYWDDTLSKEAETYVYKIEAVDKCSNATVFETESISIPSRTMPKAVISADRVMIVGAEYAIDGGMSYDDNAIVSYTWDLGDGNTSTDKCVIHAYAATGIYVVTLTVTDDEGKTHTTTQEIEVINDDLAGSVVVQIVDEEGKPIPGAPVYFNLGTEEQVIKETGSSGMASFVAKAGKYAVGCVIPNNQWLPTKKDIIVTAGSNTNITMTLVNKPIVEGRFEIERMTLDEIIAAGIDPTDPVNQNYVQINLHLQYDNMDIDVSIPSGGGGGGGGITPIIIPGGGDGEDDEDGAVGDYDGGSRILFPIPIREYNPSEEIAVALLDIPLGVATLKEFFDVRLHIINNSGSEFSMLDNVITLNIPEGLSLMETYDTSGAIVRIAEIMGQTTETIEWILRGDEVGEYYISADYSGILSQFLTPIKTKFEASEPIEVFGMTNLRVILDVANALDKGTLYYNVSLINEGEIDVYRPSITGPDTLFEMELFDAKNVITAEAYDFNAMQITQLNLSQKLSALPDILGAGERLTLHYMNVNQTQYSECTFALESAMLEYQNTYGLEVELVRRPVEYFKQNLSTSINALEKAEAILKDAEHMSAYEYLITDPNYAYWCMTNDLDGLGMTNTSNEIGFELISGDWADALGKDDHEQAKKMIYAALGLTADENAFAEYSELLNFVTELYSVFKTVNTYTDFTYMTKAERNSLELAMKSMSEDYKWELYWGLYGGNKHRYGAFSDYFTFTWQVTHLNKYEVELKDGESKIIQFFKEDFISEVFTGIGMGLEQAEKIVGIMKDTAADISVYVKAQGDINTYNFYVDMLQGYMPYDSMFSDGWLMYEMLDDVRAVINSEDVMGKFIENTKEAAFWEAMDRGGSNLMSTIGIPSLILTAAGLGADFMDTLFNINEQQDVANNIRFITCMSDSINDALRRKKNDSTDTEQAAQEFMMLVKLMLDLRAIGESQVAQYGVAAEKGILPVGSRQLFVAVADYTGAPGDVTSWYLWRDYVEDKISRCRIALLKNPTGTEVTSSQKPIVTFNYATGQTAQTFDSSYKYSLDGGKTWIVCDGNAISVARPTHSVELQVRKVDISNTTMKLTASLIIYGAGYLDNQGIEVYETSSGYRIEGLNKDRSYQVTFATEEQAYTYDSVLNINIPAGSYSYEWILQTEEGEEATAYEYIYIRSLADANRYASHIYQPDVHDALELKVEADAAQGTIVGAGHYEYGETATLIATPKDGWLFLGWFETILAEDETETEVCLSGEAVFEMEMLESKTLTAKFLEIAMLEDTAKLNMETMEATGFADQVTAEEMIAYYKELGLTATVTQPEGVISDYIGTGSILNVGGRTFTIVVKGDVDGTGEVDVFDVFAMLNHLNAENTLEGVYYKAACVSGETEFSILDLYGVLDYANGKEVMW